MKKYAILFICVITIGLIVAYHTSLNKERGTQLVTQAYYGELIEVKNTVEKGAPLDYQLTFRDPQRQYSSQTFNALQAAASGGNEDVILFLLDQGMDIDTLTPDNWTPLFIAVRDGQAEAAKLLVFQGAQLNIQTNLGTTALTMAVTQDFPTEKARLDLLEYMLKRGADPNIRDIYQHTPLYYAQKKGNKEIIALLQEYGAQS